jgi:adenosylhomocysteinase
MLAMRDGALLCNAGHFNVEVDVAGLEALAVARREARPHIKAYELPNGRHINLIAEGKLVNIAAADGHPAEIMDLSFAVQYHSILYILEYRKKHGENLPPEVIDVSAKIDDRISNELLACWGVSIDKLTPQQEHYLRSWQV